MSRRPLRVGVVVPGWSGPGEGAALPALQDLLWALSPDHDVRVLALRHPAVRDPYVDRGGLPVRSLAGGTAAGLRARSQLLARGVGALRQLHDERPFDLVHAFWADEPGAVAVAAGRGLGVPVIVSVMGGELVGFEDIGYGAALGRGGRWTVRLALRGASLVTVGSGTLHRVVAARVPAAPLRQLPLGVDVDAFSPGRGGDSPGTRLLFVGSLTPVKDPVRALRAFARLRTPDALLDVAGDGPLRDGLQRLAAHLGVADRVRFLGPVSRRALLDLYRGARALVVTSRHEAQSMVAVEAAACGLAVVGTPVGVVPELARAGGAIVVPEARPAALAAVLDVLLAGDRAEELGRAGRAHALRAWDGRLVAERLADAWSRVAHPGT